MTNILDTALDAFDRFNADRDADEFFAIRDIITDTTICSMRCDLLTDIATIHLDLDDELHDMTLIAIYDRDSLELHTLILNADTDTQIIFGG